MNQQLEMNKNQIFEGTCVDYTYDGLGVVKNDTFCIFVKDMAIGDRAKIIITADKKTFAYGKILELLEKSENRTEPVCPVSRICGGCHLQHLSYPEQLAFKKKIVQNDISRIAKLDLIVEDTLSSEQQFYYRNKIMMPVGTDKNGNLISGFYRYNSHDIIPVEQCYLQSPLANEVIAKIKELTVKYHYEQELRHIMLRDMKNTAEMMIVLVTYHDVKLNLNMIDELSAASKNIKSIIQNINGEDTNVVLGKKQHVLYGEDHIQDLLCGLKFNISPFSFYQVNSYSTEILYNTALEIGGFNKNDTILDLYCGVGTIGLIASKKVKKVYGVEIVESAIENAKENARVNGITNIEFICGDAGKVTSKLLADGIHFEGMVIDPPRKGCSSDTIETIINLNPDKLVYISCNPSTLARDLFVLKEHYSIERVIPVDQFPNTYHIENIALLIRK